MKYKLSDLCSFRNGKVDVACLNNKTYISTENMLPNKAGTSLAASLPTVQLTQAYKKGDVLVSNIRPYFKKIWFANCDGGCSNDVLVFEANDTVDNDFLYYVIADDAFFLYAMATSKGTKMPRGDKTSIMKYEVPLFDIDTQKKIASILRSFDDKIKLNIAINNNLLDQAIILFSRLINGKKKNGCLGDYCVIKSGFAFKSAWWKDSGVKVIKIGSINQDNLDIANCSHISENKISLAQDFIVIGGDLLIAMTGATIGKFAMVPQIKEKILVNQRVGKFFLGDKPIEKLPFIYCQLKQDDIYNEIVNRGQGSAQPNISGADIMSIPCVIPPVNEIDLFNAQTMAMFDTIINNQQENMKLAEMRDALLPKLMSGEFHVSEIDL